MAKSAFTDEDDALLGELGVETEAKEKKSLTSREERIIAGFEDIQRFYEEHGRAPQHGEANDIFERLYAVRLDRLRRLEECRMLLKPLDHQGLLADAPAAASPDETEFDDEALLEQLGVEAETADITELKHVRSSAEKRAAVEIANRQRCEDFEQFKPLFEQVQRELDDGLRITLPFQDNASIARGDLFVVYGQKAYIAQEGDEFISDYGRKDCRLRVIFDNATEIDMLKRSLERALQKDESGRRISAPDAGPLFSEVTDGEDLASGTIYVLRSKSELTLVKQHRDVLHKIGVTSGKVERRIANAKTDATFLLAEVEIVATYELYNINRTKLENLIHRIFDSARLDIEINDRFGNPVVPREWFLVPFAAVDEAVERIKDGSIKDFSYDPKQARLVERTAG
jgi:predicted PhzF superfamily epimerase YddE/YHI9